MASWTDKSKTVTTFIKKALPGKWKWSDPNALWSDSAFTWAGVSTEQWINRLRPILAYLLNEDGTYLLLEDGGRIIISGDAWLNRTKH